MVETFLGAKLAFHNFWDLEERTFSSWDFLKLIWIWKIVLLIRVAFVVRDQIYLCQPNCLFHCLCHSHSFCHCLCLSENVLKNLRKYVADTNCISLEPNTSCIADLSLTSRIAESTLGKPFMEMFSAFLSKFNISHFTFWRFPAR